MVPLAGSWTGEHLARMVHLRDPKSGDVCVTCPQFKNPLVLLSSVPGFGQEAQSSLSREQNKIELKNSPQNVVGGLHVWVLGNRCPQIVQWSA